MAMTKKDLEMLLLKKQQKHTDILRKCADSNHKIPKTRREFLAHGLLSMSGSLMLPTLTQLISQSAWAADSECPGNAESAFPAYINIQLSGGPALFANFIPEGSDGAPLDTQKLGMGTNPSITRFFKNQAPFWFGAAASQGESKMMRALFDGLGADFEDIINQKSVFVGIAAESTDDREGTNPQDISGMLAAAGVSGKLLPYLLTGNKRNFLNRPARLITNRYKGAIIKSANFLTVETLANISDSVGGFTGVLGSTLSLNEQRKLIKGIEDLNKSQLSAITRNPASSESQNLFRRLMDCASEQNSKALNDSSDLNIYSDNNLAGIWAKNSGSTGFNTVLERSGQIIGNCMKGFSGAATIHLGGYDYHNNFFNRTQANQKDLEFGIVLARTLLTAKALGRKTFIHVTADGSLSVKPSSDAFINWSGDSPRRSLNYIIAYDPAGAPDTEGVTVGSYIDKKYQLNHFKQSTAIVDNTNPIGSLSGQELCASAAFLNYLSFAKKVDLINDPKLAQVKAKLAGSLPSGSGGMLKYYTRIKS